MEIEENFCNTKNKNESNNQKINLDLNPFNKSFNDNEEIVDKFEDTILSEKFFTNKINKKSTNSPTSSTKKLRMKQEFAFLNYSTDEENTIFPNSQKCVQKDLHFSCKREFLSC